jgi:Flp pilus assembly protein TadD
MMHGIAALVLAWLYSAYAVPVHLLGDGSHVIPTLYRFLKGAGFSTGTLMNEPLTVSIYALLARTLSAPAAADGGVNLSAYTSLFTTLAMLAGAVHALFVFRFSDALAEAPLAKLAVAIAMLCASGALLFFGYVEYYAFVYVAGSLLLLAAMLDARKDAFPALSTTLLVVAIAFHFAAIVFVPMWALVLWRWLRLRKGLDAPAAGSGLKLLAAALLLGVAFYAWLELTGKNGIFLPLQPSAWKLTLLSGQHLLDIVNNLLLDAPFAVAVLLLWILARRDFEKASFGSVLPIIAALSWLALCAAHMAIARDWDVYALLGPSAGLSAVAGIASVTNRGARKYLLIQAIVQPLIFVAPWIALNASYEPAMARYAAITETYIDLLPVNYSTAHLDNLRVAHAARGEREIEALLTMRMARLGGDPYELFKLLRASGAVEQPSLPLRAVTEEALAFILAQPDSVRHGPVGRDNISRRMTVDDVYTELMRNEWRRMAGRERAEWMERHARALLAKQGPAFGVASLCALSHFSLDAFPAALQWAQRAVADSAHAPQDSGRTLSRMVATVAVSAFQTGQHETGLRSFRLAVTSRNATAGIWADYGLACFRMELYDEARAAFSVALRRDANQLSALVNLAKIHMLPGGNRDTAKSLLRRFLLLRGSGPQADEVRGMLRKLEGK